MRKFKPGDRVKKNEDTWEPSDFDLWGRGVGIGIVVDPPFEMGSNDCDVRWKGGRCFENNNQLLPYESKRERIYRKIKVLIWRFWSI